MSDTTGADIEPYIRRLLAALKAYWLPLIPEEAYPPTSLQGETVISFTTAPDGHILAMQVDSSTKSDALNHAAWYSITSVGQFEPLPKGMKDPNLTLRIRFMVNEPLTELPIPALVSRFMVQCAEKYPEGVSVKRLMKKRNAATLRQNGR
ncbi:MAG: TonB family protein [Acidobacteriaceae bacterium]|nr:TonB family protein [Acidobacteriaceae bacterium]